MEFDKTQTFRNLARSFAGESQAGLRYQFISKLALKQGYKTLSDEIKYIAHNETAHAKVLFDKIIEKNGNTSNIDISAGYPFEGDTIENGLLAAANAEKSEVSIYRAFSETAKNESVSLSILLREYSPEISFKRVVLPQPLRPTTAILLWSLISKLTDFKIGSPESSTTPFCILSCTEITTLKNQRKLTFRHLLKERFWNYLIVIDSITG